MAFSFNPTGFNLNTSYKLFLKDEKLPSINYNDRILKKKSLKDKKFHGKRKMSLREKHQKQ